jgi:hypothetical protein
MEWDPQTFLPNLRDYVIPEYQRLQRYGASRVSLSQLESNIANLQQTPLWYHNFHFSGNTIAIITAAVGLVITLFMCVQSQRKRARERRGQKIEDAVRLALCASTPHHLTYASPLALPMPIVSHPPSTVFVQSPVNPHHLPETILQMSRLNSYTNLTSISEVPRPPYEDTVRPLTPSCPTKSMLNSPDVPPMYTHGY